MTEKDEITPEEMPEEAANESPVDGDMMDSPHAPGHPAANLSGSPDEPVASEEEIAEVKEPSRFQLFLRKTLIWAGIAAALFAAGYLTFNFVIHQPKIAELENLQQQIVTLETEMDDLKATNTILEADSAALVEAEKHQALLMVMVDVYDARYALGEENTVAAKSALTGTDATLNLALADIRAFDSGLADALPQRLELIRTNIDRDVETAIEDCNQLIDDLQAVEAALYP